MKTGQTGRSWVVVLVALLALVAGANVVRAQELKIVDFPLIDTTLAKSGAGAPTNTQNGLTYTNTDPRTTAIKIAPGYGLGLTFSYSCATANNSNVVIGLAPSVDGTNYPDTATEMISITAPGTAGANTNRVYSTNLAAATLLGYQYLSVRHMHNINTAACTGLKLTATIPR